MNADPGRCPSCPAPPGVPCPPYSHVGYCTWAASGDPAKLAALKDRIALAGAEASDPAEAARLRRAAKPRVSKGCKACHTPPPDPPPAPASEPDLPAEPPPVAPD